MFSFLLKASSNKGYNLLINDETFINESQKKYGVEPKNYYASV